ncbi:hypothetical protein FRB93_001016 [Tulasnella sp. JGI-2019a]|nr:hypothetical protein FRB93_001016 [Tulasnella sp. JGI-2019a]
MGAETFSPSSSLPPSLFLLPLTRPPFLSVLGAVKLPESLAKRPQSPRRAIKSSSDAGDAHYNFG